MVQNSKHNYTFWTWMRQYCNWVCHQKAQRAQYNMHMDK
jgi:hypothetical protein